MFSEESLSLSTSKVEYQPYVVTLVIKKGKHLPVGDLHSSDPYVVLKIGNRIVGRTPVVRFSLNPEWNHAIEIPLLHISNSLTFEIWDHDDVGSHDVLGTFEVNLSEFPSNTQSDLECKLEQFPTSRIKARGSVTFSIYVKCRRTLISVKSAPRKPPVVSPELETLISSEFSHHATAITIQQALKESGYFSSRHISWTKLRDVLGDVHKVLARDEVAIDPNAPPSLIAFPSSGPASSAPENVLPTASNILCRLESDTLLTRAVRMHMYSNTVEEVPPQYRHSFVLETRQHAYTLIAPNIFMMWSWVRTIRRNFMAYNMAKEANDAESSVGVGMLYRSFHMPHVEGSELNTSLTGTLSVLIDGQLFSCRCSLNGLTMDCRNVSDDRAEVVTLNLQGLQSIVLSQEYEASQSYELATSVESGKVPVTALTDIGGIKRQSKVIDTSSEDTSAKRENGWYPGKAIVKGTLLTGKLVAGVVKGTVKAPLYVVKGTAGLASSAADGLVSAAAAGLGVPQADVVTFAVLQVPHKRAVVSDPVSGIAPYWDKQCIIKMDRFMVGEFVDESDNGDMRPAGVLAHIVGVMGNSETVLGSRLLRYEDLLPENCLDKVRDDSTADRGGNPSEIAEVAFHLDEDVEFIVEVHKGEGLLPPPSTECLNTLISNPLKTFVDLSSTAVAKVGLTTQTSRSQDRCPRLICSLAKHNGSTLKRQKKYKSRAMSKTLNPEWNQAFVLTVDDGLHRADLVKLVIKDDSRSGPDSVMGSVFIPKELFLSKRVAMGETLRMRFPVVTNPNMSAEAARYQHGLGHLDVSLQMNIKKMDVYSDKSTGVDSTPKMSISTQLYPSNEFTSSWMCDCVTKFAMEHLQSNSVERFHMTPSFEGIVLDALDNGKSLFNVSGGNNKQQQMLLHQFLTKEITTLPAGWDGTPPKDVEKFTYHVYQNERRGINLQWGGQFLLPHERREFTDESGTVICPFSPLDTGLDPPHGFEWDEDCRNTWIIDKGYTKVDSDGWVYGADFGYIMNNYRNGQSVTAAGIRPTRRRRWKRVAIRVLSEFPAEHPSDPAPESTEVNMSRNFSDFLNGTDDGMTTDTNPRDEEIIVEIFENQRRNVAMYWGKHLLAGLERGAFSDEAGEVNFHIESLETADPPAGYSWVDDEYSNWEIDMDYTNTDDKGWCYAFDFNMMMHNLKKGKSVTKGTGLTVRRRKWRRRAVKVRETIADFTKGKTVADMSAIIGGSLGEDEYVARRSVVNMTRQEAFVKHRDDILLLCQERPDLQSPITIPWNQISRVDIVTPSVVIIGTTVHRYFGIDSYNVEQYKSVEVEVCVLDCPAEKLCQLIRERIRLREFRENVRKLVASGTMTGKIGVFDYTSAHSGAGDDAPPTDMLVSEQDLSLGSATILGIEDEIAEVEESIKAVQRVHVSNSDPVTKKWHKSEIAYLTDTKIRLKMYSAALLGAALSGPAFEEEGVRETLRRDLEEAEKVFNWANTEGDSVGAAQEMINNLLLTADLRIRDTALCGWSHQGPVLEKCLSIIINEYYIAIVGVLGKFFDSKEGLMQLKGNESKLRLIRCFMQNETHLRDIVFSSLRPYSIIVDPAPVLSLSLDISTMVHWYTDALEAEIKVYMHNVFITIYNAESFKDAEYKLPWDITQDGTTWISMIPRDSISVMINFIELVRMAGRSSSRSAAMEDFAKLLDEKIRITHIECFVFLIERYREVLLNHDWTIPVPCKGVVFNADQAFDAIGTHMYWLASVANDSTLILSRHIDACVKAIDGHSAMIEMSAASVEAMGRKMYKLTKLLGSTISSAMDSLSCIVFKSYSDIMPTKDIFRKWTHSRGNTPDLVTVILREQASYVSEVIGETLEQPCMEKFREFCLRKISVWYLCLMHDAASSGETITPGDAELLREDCRKIKKFFEERAEGYSSSHLSRIFQDLTLFTDISNIVTHSFGSRDFSQSVYNLIDLANSEKYRAQSLKALLKTLFKFRGSYAATEESELGVDVVKLQKEFLAQFDLATKEGGKKIIIPKTVQIEPPADMVVFSGNAFHLEDYLIRSALERSRAETKVAKESERAAAEEDRAVEEMKNVSEDGSGGQQQRAMKRGSVLGWLSGLTHHSTHSTQEDALHAASNAAPPVPTGDALLKPIGAPQNQNIIEITGISSDSLFSLDAMTNPSVYVEFVLGSKKGRTEFKKNTLSPSWSDKIALSVIESSMVELYLECTVFYHMRFRADIRAGTVRIPVAPLLEMRALPIQEMPLDCSNSSSEIQQTIKSESKDRLPPTLSMTLSLLGSAST